MLTKPRKDQDVVDPEAQQEILGLPVQYGCTNTTLLWNSIKFPPELNTGLNSYWYLNQF